MNVFSQICHHYRAEDTRRSQIKANLLLYWRPGSNPIGNKRRMKKERKVVVDVFIRRCVFGIFKKNRNS
jgi:hypothetical protein